MTTALRAGPVAAGHVVRHPVLASRRRVVHALGVATLVDLVEAVAGADARPDPVLLARLDFRDDVRIGDMRAGHPHQVDQPVADRMARGRHVVDPCGVHDRDLQGLLDPARELEVRRDRRAHRRDHAGQRLVAGHVALDDADEVDTLGHHALGDLDAVVVLQATVGVLVERHPDADGEVRPCRLAHCPNHPQREPKPVLEAAHPVLVVAVVGQRGPERVEQMGVGLEFDAVQTRLPASGRRIGVCLHDAVHIPNLRHLREGAVRGLPDRRRRDDRKPVAVVVARAPAQMGDLAHHRRAVLVHPVGQLA